MTLIKFDPGTRMPVAARHATDIGWVQAVLAEHGVERLCQDVVADLVEADPAHFAAIDPIATVTAWARCTALGCVATGAVLDPLNAEPFTDLALAADLTAAVAAARAQLAAEVMVFADLSADEPVVWAYRAGVLREVALYVFQQAFAHAHRGEGAAEDRPHAACERAQQRAAVLGLDLNCAPGDLARLDAGDDAVWERIARALHGLVAGLAPLVDQHPMCVYAGGRP